MKEIIVDFIFYVFGAGSGFLGGYILDKYKSKTSSDIKNVVDSTLDKATSVINDVK